VTSSGIGPVCYNYWFPFPNLERRSAEQMDNSEGLGLLWIHAGFVLMVGTIAALFLTI